MSLARRCSRTACGRPAVNTLTYVYADQTAVLGPLATYAEPHAYDLCDEHSERLSAPRGWEVLRLSAEIFERLRAEREQQVGSARMRETEEALRRLDRATTLRVDAADDTSAQYACASPSTATR